MRNEAWIDEVLSKKGEKGQERCIRVFAGSGGKLTIDGREYLSFSSNDYLNLANHPDVIERSRILLEKHGAGATASRLVAGTLGVHDELEHALASFRGSPSAVLFGTGYLANAGVITSLVGGDDHIFLDRLAHASIVDAAVTSRGRIHRFRHNDCEHLNELLSGTKGGKRLVVAESLYSMDGDIAPLQDIVSVAECHNAMIMVDEAHATGVFGPCGRGLVSEFGLMNRVNVSMGTLGKSFGSYGGFIACSQRIRALCVNQARSLIYTTAPPPSAVGAALGALHIIEQEPDLGSTLLRRAKTFRARLVEAGYTIPEGHSQIIPLIIGGNRATMSFAERLRASGIIVNGIRPPTVPAGTSRLRFSVTLAHEEVDLEHAAGVIEKTGSLLGVI